MAFIQNTLKNIIYDANRWSNLAAASKSDTLKHVKSIRVNRIKSGYLQRILKTIRSRGTTERC